MATEYNDYYCHHISGCCQIFRKDLFNFGFELDKNYGFFWCEDTDLSMQSLYLNKINYRINGNKYIKHELIIEYLIKLTSALQEMGY